MAVNIRKFLQGLGLVPVSSTAVDTQGEMEVLSASGKLNYHNGTTASPVVTEAHSATLTNKTIDGGSNTITGITATSITNNTITNAKLAQMAAHTFKGNNTGSTADPLDLTATQLTAELNVFSSTIKGLTPASGGGTVNFLRADGTFAAPASGISTTLTDSHILVGNGSNVATDVAVSGDLTLANTGAFTIANLAVTNAKIANTTIDLTTKVTGILPNANTTAASTNTASAIVTRDASGNFSASAITLSTGTNPVLTNTFTGAQATTGGGQVFASANSGATMTSGNRMGVFGFQGFDGTSSSGSAAMRGIATETFSTSAHGSKLSFAVTANTTTTLTERLLIDQDGSITMSKYTAGIAHLSSGGLISSSAIALATADVSGVLPSANVALKRTINAQSGTTYTFVLADGSDAGGNPLVTATNASAQTYTVPTNASVAFPTGTQIDVIQQGAGKVTFAAAGGVTINSLSSNLSIGGQYVGVSLVKTATDTWTLIGNLIA